jgi:hypothetical protein
VSQQCQTRIPGTGAATFWPTHAVRRSNATAQRVIQTTKQGIATSIATGRKIDMSKPAVTQTAQEFYQTMPHCCGYPNCDGDLEGQGHDPGCPLYPDCEELGLFDFAEAYAASLGLFDFAEAYAASRERWIPVADPPSSSEEVLTINNSTGIYILGNYLGAEGWCDEDGDPIHPTHYMFRPAPPRGENAELKQKGNASHACYCGELPSGKKCMACQLQTAERSLAELRKKAQRAVRRYGMHDFGCAWLQGKKVECSCGLHEAERLLKEG